MRQTGFITPLRVEAVDPINWCLLEDFVWNGTQGDTFICQKGMLTDFASVPWWSQFILPRTGTWTKAATLHDKMCDELNDIYRLNKMQGATVLIKPTFNSIDTDAIFRKNAREDGTDPIRSELLWFGVRCGALKNAARRKDWTKTFWRWFADLIAILVVLAAVAYGIFWVAHL